MKSPAPHSATLPSAASHVTIPQSELGARLVEAEAIKAEMTSLLQDLETEVAGRPIAKPGSWRHHPLDWPPQ